MNRYRYSTYQRPPYHDPLVEGSRWKRNSHLRDDGGPLLNEVIVESVYENSFGPLVIAKEVNALDINYRQFLSVESFRELYDEVVR